MKVKIDISIGELLDRITILEIKLERIKNPDNLILIKKDLTNLQRHKNNILSFPENLFIRLKLTNEKLWLIKNRLRFLEKKNDFNSEFVGLARELYYTSDKRNELKNEINKYCKSDTQEIKEYENGVV